MSLDFLRIDRQTLCRVASRVIVVGRFVLVFESVITFALVVFKVPVGRVCGEGFAGGNATIFEELDRRAIIIIALLVALIIRVPGIDFSVGG